MIEYIENNYKIGLIASTIITILGIFSSYIFKSSYVIFSILGLVLGVCSYACARPKMKEEEIDINFKYVGVTILAGVLGLIHHILYSSIYKSVVELGGGEESLSQIYLNMANVTFPLSFIVNAAIIVFTVLFLKDEERREKILVLKNMSFKKLDENKEEASKVEPDIVLCRDAETGKEVIWPHSDRYTHCLCLGPTGSGKTSQTIIPFIYQDIQKSNVGITVLEPKGVTKNKMLPALCK